MNGIDPEFYEELLKTYTPEQIQAAFSNDPKAQRLVVKYRRGPDSYTAAMTSSSQHNAYVAKGWTATAA